MSESLSCQYLPVQVNIVKKLQHVSPGKKIQHVRKNQAPQVLSNQLDMIFNTTREAKPGDGHNKVIPYDAIRSKMFYANLCPIYDRPIFLT